jgi:tetratricopeptide (TPR) repeat protein
MAYSKRNSIPRKVAIAIVLVGITTGGFFWKPLYTSFIVFRVERQMSMCSLQMAKELAEQLQKVESKTGTRSAKQQFLLGRAVRRIGNIDVALEHFATAEQLGFDKDEIRHQRQLVLFQRGHLEQSQELNRLLRQDLPDDRAYEVYEALAKGYLFSYRFKDALQLLEFWIEWQQTATDPRIWRAGVWEQTESWSEAIEEYRGVLQIDARNLEARLALARILMQRLNKTEEARAELSKCLEISPDDAASQIGMAACERQLADPEKAELLLRRVLASNAPKELLVSARLELGQVLLDRQNIQESVSLLQQVVEEIPQDNTAHYALGTALSAADDQEKAQQQFEKARELVAQYSRLAIITQSLVNKPDDPDLRWEAGDIFMKQGLFTEGAAWMSTALIYDANHQKTHESLAHYYETVRKDPRMAEQHRSKLEPKL